MKSKRSKSPKTRQQGTSEQVEWGQLMTLTQAEALLEREHQRRREQALARPLGKWKTCPQCQRNWEAEDLVDESDRLGYMCHRCKHDYNLGKLPRCGFCGHPEVKPPAKSRSKGRRLDNLGSCEQCKKTSGKLAEISISAACLDRNNDLHAKDQLDRNPFWKRIRAFVRKEWGKELSESAVVQRLIDNLLAERKVPDENAARMMSLWDVLWWLEKENAPKSSRSNGRQRSRANARDLKKTRSSDPNQGLSTKLQAQFLALCEQSGIAAAATAFPNVENPKRLYETLRKRKQRGDKHRRHSGQ